MRVQMNNFYMSLWKKDNLKIKQGHTKTLDFT